MIFWSGRAVSWEEDGESIDCELLGKSKTELDLKPMFGGGTLVGGAREENRFRVEGDTRDSLSLLGAWAAE